MTDKQTIIDGVDVSGCEYYDKDKPLLTCICEEYPCNECPNCYYKQLARKEQECNKLYIQLKADEEYHKEEENTLRKIIKNKEERNIELYKENNQLKVNNEKFRKELMQKDELITFYMKKDEINTFFNTPIDGWSNDHCEICPHKAENEELKKQNNQFDNGINEQFSKIVKLEGRNNLLKAILTEIKEIAVDNVYYLDCDYRWILENILQKISECEVKDDR